MNFIPFNIHSSWNAFLTDEIRKQIHEIEQTIEESKNVKDFILLPEENNVLVFLTRDLNAVTKLWIGMDPYPETYFEDGKEIPVANGRAFWPNNAISWQDFIKEASLRNILRNYYNEKFQHEKDWRKIRKFADIRKEIADGVIDIKEPQEWFKDLEDSGVLFLNTTFTLARHNQNDYTHHIDIWKEFTSELFKYIVKMAPKAKWCVWGHVAEKATLDVPDKNKQFSFHPSRCTVDKNNFLKNKGLF